MSSFRVVSVLLAAQLTAAPAGSQEPTGASLYANNCAACHGELGEGDGPVASVMRVSMPNLRTLSMRNDGAFPADAVREYVDGRSIPQSHGDRYMPIWGDVFGWGATQEESEERAGARIDAIVEHL